MDQKQERDHELRMQGVEEALESFRSTLRTSFKSDLAEEAVAAFDELVSLVKSSAKMGSVRRTFLATITYGNGKVVELGPTSSRDRADALAKAWMEGHAGVTSKGEPVKGVKIVASDEEED